jgi:hypothetical protein
MTHDLSRKSMKGDAKDDDTHEQEDSDDKTSAIKETTCFRLP